MQNNLYSGMLNGLSKVNLSSFGRAQAELHMARAAALVEMVMGSGKKAMVEAEQQPTPAVVVEEYRRAA